MKQFTAIIKSFFGVLIDGYNRHLELLLLSFQPVVEDIEILQNLRARKHNFIALFPLTFHMLIIIDAIIQYTSGQNQYFQTALLKILGDSVSRLADIPCGTIYVLIVICSAFLLFEKNNHVGWILFLDRTGERIHLRYPYENSPVLELGLQNKLVEFHDGYHRRMRAFLAFYHYEVLLSVVLPLFVYEGYLTLVSDGQYLPDPRVVIVGLTAPYYMRCLLFVINIGLQFMAQNRMIQLKNRHHQQGIDQKWTELRRRTNNRSFHQSAYRSLQCFLRELLNISAEIQIFNTFYSRYITFILTFFCLIGCAVLKAVLENTSGFPVYQSTSWILFGVLYISYSLLFNLISSLTIHSNKISFKSLRRFQMSLTSGRSLTAGQLVKLDLVNEYRWLMYRSYFRLLNSVPLNNRLFFFDIFGLLSFFYFKLTLDF